MTLKFRDITEEDLQHIIDGALEQCVNKNNIHGRKCVENWVRLSIHNMQELDNIVCGKYIMVSNLNKFRAVTIENNDSQKPQIGISLENYNNLSHSDMIDMMTHIVKHYFVEDSGVKDPILLFEYLFGIFYNNIQDIVLLEDLIDKRYTIVGGMNNQVFFKRADGTTMEYEPQGAIWDQIEEIIKSKEQENG